MISSHLNALAMILHFIGITGIAGGFFGNIFIERQLWKQLKVAPYRAVTLLPVIRVFPTVIQLGSIVMLISGLMLLSSLNWELKSEVWFSVKMILYLFFNLNCLLVAKPTSEKLGELIPNLFETDPEVNTELASLRRKMKWFHISELVIIIGIYIVSVYKF